MKLLIDFQTQQGNAVRNDCGFACVAMAAGVPLAMVLERIPPAPQGMYILDVMDGLRLLGVANEYVHPLHLPDARRWLANGNPIVALVGYGRLPQQLRATAYSGNHYVVIVGYEPDGGFLVHDPLWPDERGAFRIWPDAVLGEAWANPVNALPLQGVVVKNVFEVAEVAMGDVLPLVRDEAARNAVAYLEQLLGAMDVRPGPLAERVEHALAWVEMKKGRA